MEYKIQIIKNVWNKFIYKFIWESNTLYTFICSEQS